MSIHVPQAKQEGGGSLVESYASLTPSTLAQGAINNPECRPEATQGRLAISQPAVGPIFHTLHCLTRLPHSFGSAEHPPSLRH
jgi:hypothetical protein